MDIDGMGRKRSRRVPSLRVSGRISPIFINFKNHASQIKELDGWSDKSINASPRCDRSQQETIPWKKRLLFGLASKKSARRGEDLGA